MFESLHRTSRPTETVRSNSSAAVQSAPTNDAARVGWFDRTARFVSRFDGAGNAQAKVGAYRDAFTRFRGTAEGQKFLGRRAFKRAYKEALKIKLFNAEQVEQIANFSAQYKKATRWRRDGGNIVDRLTKDQMSELLAPMANEQTRQSLNNLMNAAGGRPYSVVLAALVADLVGVKGSHRTAFVEKAANRMEQLLQRETDAQQRQIAASKPQRTPAAPTGRNADRAFIRSLAAPVGGAPTAEDFLKAYDIVRGANGDVVSEQALLKDVQHAARVASKDDPAAKAGFDALGDAATMALGRPTAEERQKLAAALEGAATKPEALLSDNLKKTVGKLDPLNPEDAKLLDLAAQNRSVSNTAFEVMSRGANVQAALDNLSGVKANQNAASDLKAAQTEAAKAVRLDSKGLFSHTKEERADSQRRVLEAKAKAGGLTPSESASLLKDLKDLQAAKDQVATAEAIRSQLAGKVDFGDAYKKAVKDKSAAEERFAKLGGDVALAQLKELAGAAPDQTKATDSPVVQVAAKDVAAAPTTVVAGAAAASPEEAKLEQDLAAHQAALANQAKQTGPTQLHNANGIVAGTAKDLAAAQAAVDRLATQAANSETPKDGTAKLDDQKRQALYDEKDVTSQGDAGASATPGAPATSTAPAPNASDGAEPAAAATIPEAATSRAVSAGGATAMTAGGNKTTDDLATKIADGIKLGESGSARTLSPPEIESGINVMKLLDAKDPDQRPVFEAFANVENGMGNLPVKQYASQALYLADQAPA